MSEVQALQKEEKIPLTDSSIEARENGDHSPGKPNSPNTKTTVELEPAKVVPEPETANTVKATPNTVLITLWNYFWYKDFVHANINFVAVFSMTLLVRAL